MANSGTTAYTVEATGLQDFLKSLNKLDENVNSAVVNGLKQGAEVIRAEQKRLISSKSSKLPNFITVGQIKTNKKGNLVIDVGYSADAVRQVPEGVILEFGRPSGNKKTMKQIRKGKSYTVKIGKIQAFSHIRRGFDNKINEAVKVTIDCVDAELKKMGG